MGIMLALVYPPSLGQPKMAALTKSNRSSLPCGSVSRVNVHGDTHTYPKSLSRSGMSGSSPLCYSLAYHPVEPSTEALA